MILLSLCRTSLGRRALVASLWVVVSLSACVFDEPLPHVTIRLQTKLRPAEEISKVRLHLSAGEPPEVFYDETWQLGSAELPELPATVTVKQGRADAISVVADALLDDFLVDRQGGELVFSDPVRSQLTLELGPRFLCGNGVLDEGEECDCGQGAAVSVSCPAPNSDISPEACRTDCQLARCGDGVVDAAEACDDGNDVDEDACTSSCEVNVCGDGLQRPQRACWTRSREPPPQLMQFPAVACVRDLDGDGVPEVMAHSEVPHPTVHILGYKAGGGFRQLDELNAGGLVTAVYPGMLDADPGLDLMVIMAAPAEVQVYAGGRDGSFQAAPTSRFSLGDSTITASAAGHLDGDGDLDVAVAVGNDLWLLGSNGIGGMESFASSPVHLNSTTLYLAMEDANGDALTDLLVLPDGLPELWLFPGDGQGGVGTKVLIPLGAVPHRLLVGLVDQDAAPDVMFIDELFRLWLYHGDGAAGFAPSAWSPLRLPLQPTHLAIGDVDGDGWVDLVLFEVRLGRANGVAVAFALGQPEVAPEATMFEGFSHRLGPPALADIDGDGDLDLLIPENDLWAGHPLHLLRNEP